MKLQRALTFLVIIILTLTACNLPSDQRPQVDSNAIFTAAAQTVEAKLTQNALLNPPTAAPATQMPTIAAASTATSQVPVATIPLVATNTPVPQPSAAATQSCDAAQFVIDVNIPDGTIFGGGEAFTKTWKLKNTGSCTWDTSYALVYDSGDQMGGPASQSLAGSVAPGQEVDISVALKAPTANGTYRGYWRLRNPAGVLLPVANGYGAKSFYVEIKVGSGSTGSTGGKFAVTSVAFTVTHSGSCAAGKYNIQATISASGAGEVTYYWVRSDGATDTATHPTLVFSSSGSQSVATEWSTSATGLWIDLYIDKPNHQQFGRALLNCP